MDRRYSSCRPSASSARTTRRSSARSRPDRLSPANGRYVPPAAGSVKLTRAPHVAGARLRLEAANARLDERSQRDALQLVRQSARVDAGEVEQILDEPREATRLLLQRREVLVRVRETVLDRLEHRRDRRDRRPQVVARRGDQLTACVEEALQV